jgi:hypothetical protein
MTIRVGSAPLTRDSKWLITGVWGKGEKDAGQERVA